MQSCPWEALIFKPLSIRHICINFFQPNTCKYYILNQKNNLQTGASKYSSCIVYLEVALAWFAATDMARSRPAISVNAGRCDGSGAQHCSISLLHSGSHEAGTGGLNVLFTIPPARGVSRGQSYMLMDEDNISMEKKFRVFKKDWVP